MFAALDELSCCQSPRRVVCAAQPTLAFLGSHRGELSCVLLKVVVPCVVNVTIVFLGLLSCVVTSRCLVRICTVLTVGNVDERFGRCFQYWVCQVFHLSWS